jgi:hypothetical protein
MPNLVSLREKTLGKGIEVVCVSDEEDPVIESFVENRGYPESMFYRSPRESKKYTAGGIPLTLIVDREGKIRGSHLGAAAWDDEAVVALLIDLAEEGSQAAESPQSATETQTTSPLALRQ